jgi:hypothetical protein
MKIPLSKLRWQYYGGSGAVVGIVVGLVLGSIFAVVGYFVWQTEEDYDKHGLPATGTVTRKDHRVEPAHGPKGRPQTIYTVSYQYADEQGHTHEGHDGVDANVWNQCQKGQPIAVQYLRDRPEQSRIVAGRSLLARWGYVLLLGIGGVLLAATLTLALGGWIWAGRKARLVQDGTPFLGTVTGHETRALGKGKQQPSYRLVYTFTDADGTERSGKSVWLSRDLQARWQDDVSILALQDPNRPDRFEADVFEARADDRAALTEESESS